MKVRGGSKDIGVVLEEEYSALLVLFTCKAVQTWTTKDSKVAYR